MERLNLTTSDIATKNIEKLGLLFPNCLTEKSIDGKIFKAIDFDILRQEVAHFVVEGPEQRYQFTWPDKRAAIRLANTPISKTLRPCRAESVDFDTTQNLYIEGDNLDVLKLLRENYLGKVKMIYIDPPYNTGNDFVYNDDFAQGKTEFEQRSGLFDAEGHQTIDPMQRNTEANGRFHTDWLNMIYPRLKVARDLLSDDGAIFISIGDDEEANLIKVCDEIFGEHNFIANICHKHRASISNDRIISENHNHLIFYARNILTLFPQQKLIGEDPILEGFRYEDNNGLYKLTPVDGPGGAKKGNPYYEFLGVTGYWRYSKETMLQKYNNGLIVRTQHGLQQKYYLEQAKKTRQTVSTWWDTDFLTSSATKELSKLMGGKIFDNPKNINLILRTLRMLTKFTPNAIVLDFFSGSATTAHAVMQLNAEDGGNRKFIMVQLPEKTDPKSEAYKAGYPNICEIGKERIRRAGKKIKEELAQKAATVYNKLYDMCGGAIDSTNPSAIKYWCEKASDDQKRELVALVREYQELNNRIKIFDTGFRVLKLDSSNMADVYYTPAQTPIEQTLGFEAFEDNIKPDRTAEDLLFQVMPECNLPLSSRIEEREIHGKKVYAVDDNYLVACFDRDIDEQVITEIARMQPYYFVMRDASAATDNVLDNFDQIFNAYSKETIRRIL